MTIKIGYAAGAYDLFHIGHLNLLKHARGQCDYLIAGVVDDDLVELAKGKRPVIPLAERLEIVASIRFVDEARPEVHPDKMNTWREVGFHVFFKGDDWKGTPQGMTLERRFGDVGVEVVYFPYSLQTSSSLLRRALDALTEQPGTGRTSSFGTG
ncbi:adenylyltransferase/cytidyltransferase family protein [Pseudarthrobacter sulfonivorans]|uniref:adenylyltransferase/cytidyltransferase family protein n=1 Tax=Pseudarthrobacter sulfonivorans TaxID=121292 RepID=UPI00285447DC|nr:adenylyltransferase/cytidyltransferase family protein [Pseudarthrobacter sulfonivorans]MDR6414904.1 glycerol-3-phosphate cytidylyltransferase [Pseudarthrobacter sulfonivorans]